MLNQVHRSANQSQQKYSPTVTYSIDPKFSSYLCSDKRCRSSKNLICLVLSILLEKQQRTWANVLLRCKSNLKNLKTMIWIFQVFLYQSPIALEGLALQFQTILCALSFCSQRFCHCFVILGNMDSGSSATDSDEQASKKIKVESTVSYLISLFWILWWILEGQCEDWWRNNVWDNHKWRNGQFLFEVDCPEEYFLTPASKNAQGVHCSPCVRSSSHFHCNCAFWSNYWWYLLQTLLRAEIWRDCVLRNQQQWTSEGLRFDPDESTEDSCTEGQ